MKTFIIEEKFTGYANITIEAETEEEAMNRYRSGDYKDSSYDIDDMFYDYEFCSSMKRMKHSLILTIQEASINENNYINWWTIWYSIWVCWW